MTRAKLKLVDPVEQPKDIAQLLREEINARDWSVCHIQGDRAKPLDLPDGVRRWWRG